MTPPPTTGCCEQMWKDVGGAFMQFLFGILTDLQYSVTSRIQIKAELSSFCIFISAKFHICPASAEVGGRSL